MHAEEIRQKKERDYEFGRFAEKIATEMLITKGYAIREHNWRCGKCEIDIIAQQGTEIVFIEVKARSNNWARPDQAIDLRKMRLLSRAADSYLRNLPLNFSFRFDVITLTGDFDNYHTEHIEDAFLPPLSAR